MSTCKISGCLSYRILDSGPDGTQTTLTDYGRWSTDMMKSLVAGKTVTVTYFQRDRYGRILGQVYAPDGMNINQFMVRAGAAWVYEQYNTDPVLPVLQNEARQQKRGLWSDADPVPPWIWRHRK